MGALPQQHKDCRAGEAEVCRAALGLPGSCWRCRESELWGSITLLAACLRYWAARCKVLSVRENRSSASTVLTRSFSWLSGNRVRTFVLPSFFFLLINVFGFFFFPLLLLLNARSAYKCTPLLSPSHQKSWQAPEQGLGCTLKAISPKSACLIFGPPSQRVSIYTSDVKLQFVVPRGSRSHVLSAQLRLRFGCFQLHKTQQNQQLDIG